MTKHKATLSAKLNFKKFIFLKWKNKAFCSHQGFFQRISGSGKWTQKLNPELIFKTESFQVNIFTMLKTLYVLLVSSLVHKIKIIFNLHMGQIIAFSVIYKIHL